MSAKSKRPGDMKLYRRWVSGELSVVTEITNELSARNFKSITITREKLRKGATGIETLFEFRIDTRR